MSMMHIPLLLLTLPFSLITAENTPSKPKIHSESTQDSLNLPHRDFEPHTLMTPLLPLSKEPPISLSLSNRFKHIDNPQILSQELTNTENFINTKTPPWKLLQAILAVLLFYLILKIPTKTPEKKISPEITALTLRTQALQQIEALSNLTPTPQTNYSTEILQLDLLMRQFIEVYFHIDAPTLTTPEFLKIAASTPSLDPHSRSLLATFLDHTDQVKFAQHHPTAQEFSNVLQTAKKFIENA